MPVISNEVGDLSLFLFSKDLRETYKRASNGLEVLKMKTLSAGLNIEPDSEMSYG